MSGLLLSTFLALKDLLLIQGCPRSRDRIGEGKGKSGNCRNHREWREKWPFDIQNGKRQPFFQDIHLIFGAHFNLEMTFHIYPGFEKKNLFENIFYINIFLFQISTKSIILETVLQLLLIYLFRGRQLIPS